MTNHTLDMVIFVLVVGARFLVPFLIPRFPLSAIIAALIIDAADQTIFEKFTGLDLTNYQSYDKALDIFYLTVAYLSVIRNWRNVFAVEVARFLWYYRLLGVVLFELSGARALLFVFPNTFEYFFIAYEAVRTGWDPRRLSRSAVLWMAGVIWVVIKLPQEWWIHIAQNDFTDVFQETLFGVEPGSRWSDTFANRPVVAISLVVAVLVVAIGVVYLWRRLPQRDWSIRFDVDAPVAVSGDHVDPVGTTGPEVRHGHAPDGDALSDARVLPMRWPLVEKFVLISLVSLIFAEMLGVNLPAWQVFPVTALVVVINAAISHWFVRDGAEWGSIASSMVALVVVNSITLSAFVAISQGHRADRAMALFFGILLSTLIVMYDRFRAQRCRYEFALCT